MNKVSRLFLILALVFGQISQAAVQCGNVHKPAGENVEVEDLVRATLDAKANERLTLEVMKLIALRRSKNQDTVLGWIRGIQERQALQPLNVLEHSALVFVYRSELFTGPQSETIYRELEANISMSYQHLTGTKASLEIELGPLPVRVVNRSGSVASLFHDAVFRDTTPAEKRPNVLSRSFREIKKHFNITNVMTTILGAAMFCSDSGRSVLAGLLVGLSQASLNEYMIHIGVGHANEAITAAFHKMGTPGKFAEEITLAYRVHHAVVGFDFGSAEMTAEQKDKANKIVRVMAEDLILNRMLRQAPEKSAAEIRASQEFRDTSEALVATIVRGNYGVNGTVKGAIAMLVTASPLYIMNFAIYAGTKDPAYLVSSNIALTTMILQSLYSHWYLHYREGDPTAKKLNAFQMWYVNDSPLGQLAQRLHFAHHETPFPIGSTKNGVIMAASVTDRIKGDLSQATVKDLIEMYEQDFLPELRAKLN